MLDTRLTEDITLRCDALSDRVAATPVGRNPHALRVALAECDAIERVLNAPYAVCKLRDARHWLRLAYGDALHGYPGGALRSVLLRAIAGVSDAARRAG